MEKVEESGRASDFRFGNNTSSLSTPKGMLSQRIVSVEYYMAAPVKEFDNMYSDFRSSLVKRVPVIRIYGSTPAGQKICANIHGVYPYITILDDETVAGFEFRVASALDKAINDAIKANRFGNAQNNQHVFKVLRVVGKTFYGFRSNNEVFLRIFFYNPMILKKAVDLLQEGNILGRRFQPYEAHIPYTLQFMIDYSLYGMNFVHYSAVKFRRNEKTSDIHKTDVMESISGSSSPFVGYFDPDDINENLMGPGHLSKLTLCELEVDVVANDIVCDTVTVGVDKAMSVNPGIDLIWKDEIERRRQQGVESCSQITIPESQERSHAVLIHSAEERFQQILWTKVGSFFENEKKSMYDSSFTFTSQVNDSEILPSSQIPDHLSGESGGVNIPEVINGLPQDEEDEFMKLLEEMAAEVDCEQSDRANEKGLGETEENEEVLEGDPNDDVCWDDSLLSSSILESIEDAEMSHEKSPTNGIRKACRSPVIFQGDGQANDSDSGSDDATNTQQSQQKEKSTTRVSRRISERRARLSKGGDSSQQNKRKSVKTLKVSESPASRLSLSKRRQSRSQELNVQDRKDATNLRAKEPTTSRKTSSQGENTTESTISRTRSLSSERFYSKKLSQPQTPVKVSSEAPMASFKGTKKVKTSEPGKFEETKTIAHPPMSPSQKEQIVKIAIVSMKKLSAGGLPSSSVKLNRHSPVRQLSHDPNESKTNQINSSKAVPVDTIAQSESKQQLPVPVIRSKRIAARKGKLIRKSVETNISKSSEPGDDSQGKPKDESSNSDHNSKTNISSKRKRLGIARTLKCSSSNPLPDNATKEKQTDNSMKVEESTKKEELNVDEVHLTSSESENSDLTHIYNQIKKEVKTFADIGTLCKPSLVAVEMQTEKASLVNTSVLALPTVANNSSQTATTTASIETQTESEKVSVETQTDAVPSLCLCQCTCVVRERAEQGTGVQDDFKPIMESKRIQVDNVDMITRARSARFTTPQNKIRPTTLMGSPEKRRPFTESPKRRHITTPTSSRYLSALILKTPTSHHKSRSFRESPSTPTSSKKPVANCTPSRETKEGFLINSIRTASVSPKKRSFQTKLRNMEADTVNQISSPQICTAQNGTSNSLSGEDCVTMESTECDMSVNSIYEYEEESSQSHVEESQTPSSPAASLSLFQKKRIQSKHRSKTRLEKRRAATLEANRCIPDSFEYEYEPLKQPASFKSTSKWLEAEKGRVHVSKHQVEKEEVLNPQERVDESSDEEAPPPVKLFGGGNLSDGDDDDDEDTNVNIRCLTTEDNRNDIKPFTPELLNRVDEQGLSQGSSIETPRSILRQRGGGSRRQRAVSLKRKIRWEDDEPCKKIKTDDYAREGENELDSSILTYDSQNKSCDTSELDGLSFKNALGLDNSMSNFQDVKALHQCQFLTTMCIEVHCASRNGLTPDPAVDPILAIFILISSDYPENFRKAKEFKTVFILEDDALVPNDSTGEFNQNIKTYSSEIAMFEDFTGLVRSWDPDIFVGYEVEKFSFGYLIQRGFMLGKDMAQELSRLVPFAKKNGEADYPRGKEEWNGTISGRIVLNLWRLLRHEIAVQSYTFENAAYHILRRRVYKFSYESLNTMWLQKMNRFRVMEYYTIRVKGAIQIMEKLDLVNRTSELARLFGIQFYEVLSRGSQFRVESMMLRATKPLDFIAPSPTVRQRANMKAPEYLPLILEPRSNYYTDPVAVLDFQSLYPSMMMAYNYDYASLLGRVEHLGSMDRFSLGCLDHQVPPADLLKLKDHIHISPAGVAFLDKSVVRGVLPDMLEQILDTRQMVKRAMKRWKNEGTSLQKVLDSRQLGLKLIANVTYGYTSANFSGRMPCVEVADSIVSKGRETLQRAIDHVKSNYHRWGGDVVYGDTDSLFVLFRGKTREEAFKLAYEIADEVTQSNPKPVKLKFEKIYQPCILQSKKRYVGYAYETPDQQKPVYDAKGIETVRRDGCPAVKKILEKSLHVLFTTNSQDKVKDYVTFQFEKLFKGRVSMQDYIFAREFRGRAGYKPGASVPSLEIAKRLVVRDPRAEPLVSERVPYVVIYGNPTLPLIKLVRTPAEYLADSSMRLNAHYYIEKAIIPALNRCFVLAGMNATIWLMQLPRKFLRNVIEHKPKGQGTLDDYILHQNCFKCDGKAERGLCNNCLEDETATVLYLQEILRNSRSKLSGCVEICKNCAGEARRCISIDCPILHKLTRYDRDQAYMKKVEHALREMEW